MEFEELQKIWDAQNNKPLYVIDEEALHNRILSKKNQGLHITNASELLSVMVNMAGGFFIFGFYFFKQNHNLFMYILSAWMLCTAFYVLVGRIRRIKAANRYDRSMAGDLDQAISVATYQVRFSQLMRWNVLPIGLLSILGILDGGKSLWIAGGMIVFLCLTHYAGRWEHNIYKRRKQELELLRNKLETM
jgi:hypothetical protein